MRKILITFLIIISFAGCSSSEPEPMSTEEYLNIDEVHQADGGNEFLEYTKSFLHGLATIGTIILESSKFKEFKDLSNSIHQYIDSIGESDMQGGASNDLKDYQTVEQEELEKALKQNDIDFKNYKNTQIQELENSYEIENSNLGLQYDGLEE